MSCPVRLGQVGTHQDRLGQVRSVSGGIRYGKDRSDQVRSGHTQDISGQVRSGNVSSGQVYVKSVQI